MVDIIEVDIIIITDEDIDLVITIIMDIDIIMDIVTELHQDVMGITVTKVSTTDTENRHVMEITGITRIQDITKIISTTGIIVLIDLTIIEVLLADPTITGALPIELPADIVQEEDKR